MTEVRLKHYLMLQPVLWTIIVLGMLMSLIVSRIVWREGGEGVVTLAMWPFLLAALVMYRKNIWQSLGAAVAVYVYAWSLVLIEEAAFGDSGFGPIMLLAFGVPALILALIVPFLTRDKTKTYFVLGGIAGGVLWAAIENYLSTARFYGGNIRQVNFLTDWADDNSIGYGFVGAIVGYVVAIVLKRIKKSPAE